MKLYEKTFENQTRAIAQEIYGASGMAVGEDLDNWAETERIAIARYKVKMFHEAGDDEWGDMWNVERG